MKRKLKNSEKLTLLFSQSTQKYQLLKDEVKRLYYVKRLRDSKLALVGDNDEAYDFILYGIDVNKEELRTLNFI